MVDWILLVLFISIILRQLWILKEVTIRTKKNIIEMIVFPTGIAVILFITYAYARTWMHYFLGMSGVILYAIDYFQAGMTSNGFASMYLHAQFVPWKKVQEVHVSIGEHVRVSYSGNGFDNRLCFKNEDYDEIMKLLNEKLQGKPVIVGRNFDIGK